MDSVKNAATQSWNGMKDRVTGGIAAAKEKFRTAHYALEPVRWIWTRVWNHTDVLAFVLMIFYLALQQDVEEISWTMGDRYVCRDYRECYRKTISDEFMIDFSLLTAFGVVTVGRRIYWLGDGQNVAPDPEPGMPGNEPPRDGTPSDGPPRDGPSRDGRPTDGPPADRPSRHAPPTTDSPKMDRQMLDHLVHRQVMGFPPTVLLKTDLMDRRLIDPFEMHRNRAPQLSQCSVVDP